MRFAILFLLASLFVVNSYGILGGIRDGVSSVGDRFKATFSDILDEFRDIKTADDLEDALDSFIFGGSPEPVGFSEIKRWQPIGDDRHVLGLDGRGNPLAIYDLSIPNPLSPKQIGRMALGSMGVGDMNLREVIRVLKTMGNDKNTKDDDDPVDKEMDDLDDINTKHGSTTDSIPSGWTNNVEFKSKKRAMEELQEGKISFSNINLSKMLKTNSKGFEKTMNTSRVYIKRIFGIDLGSNFFDHFYLTPTNDSTSAKPKYSVFFNSIFSEENIEFAMVADLRRPDTIRANVLALYLIKKLVIAIVGLLDYVQYPLGAIMEFVVHNFFKYMTEQQALGRAMLWEHLSNAEIAEDKQHPSPLLMFSSAQREEMKLYLIRRTGSWWRAMLPSILRKDEADWDKYLDQEKDYAVRSHKFMTDNGYALTRDINRWYGIYSKTDGSRALTIKSRGFYKYSMQKIIGSWRPHFAIDYRLPHLQRGIRNGYAIFDAIIAFIPGPTWPIDEILHAILNYFIRTPDAQRKGYENRLASTLLYRQFRNSSENWENELNIIYSARVNPFTLDRREEQDLLSLRWPIYGNCSFVRCRKLQVGCSWDTSTRDCCDFKCSSAKKRAATDCVWDAWQAWSPCSVSCGARGFRSSIRSVKAEPTFGGRECIPSDGVREEPCSGPPCASNCTWNGWSAWSECSSKCGAGNQFSNRTKDPAVNGGSDCVGDATRNRTCFLHACHRSKAVSFDNVHTVLETHHQDLFHILEAKESLLLELDINSETKVENSAVILIEVYLKAAKPKEIDAFLLSFEETLESFLFLDSEQVSVHLVFNRSEEETFGKKKRSEDDFGVPHVQHLGIQVIVSEAEEEAEDDAQVEPEKEEDDDDGLSKGQIVGISLGSFIAFLLILIVLVLITKGTGGDGGDYASF